jgi:hypothetical protein
MFELERKIPPSVVYWGHTTGGIWVRYTDSSVQKYTTEQVCSGQALGFPAQSRPSRIVTLHGEVIERDFYE